MAEHRNNEMPTYSQCFSDIYTTFHQYLTEQDRNYTFPHDFYNDLRKYGHFTSREVIIVCILTVLFTLLRVVLTKAVFSPLASWLEMTAVNRKKFPESMWKGLYYSSMWFTLAYLLVFSRKYDYFYKPNEIWDDWAPRMEIPADIYAVYMVQMSFYMSSLYTCIYMDSWRKDSLVMIFHHLVTIGLSVLSYATRYHKIGILALFCHDVCDIFLEFTKVNVYLKTRGGKYRPIHEKLSTAGFLGFAIVWYVFRLYLYPLKVLHTAGWGTLNVAHRPPGATPLQFYVMYNILLWTIMALNIYWFMFILNFVFKVLSGQLNEVEDTREDEVIEKLKQPNGQPPLNVSPSASASSSNGHHGGAGDNGVANGVKRGGRSRAKAD